MKRQEPNRAPPANPRNGPPWLRERRDERRDPDVLRLRRITPYSELPNVIHGEEERARNPRARLSVPTGGRRRYSASGAELREPGPFWTRPRKDERREVDVTRKRKFERRFSDIADTIHGGNRAGVTRDDERRLEGPYRKRPGSLSGIPTGPGPFWLRKRPDERREIDALRKRKFDSYSEIKDVIHGEGKNVIRRHSSTQRPHPLDLPRLCRRKSDTYYPGPFWTRDRPDFRREPDIARKRRFSTQNEIRDVIHGEEERLRARITASYQDRPINVYELPPGPSHADPFWLLERRDERREPDIDARRKFGRQKLEAAEIIHGEDFREKWYPSTSTGVTGDDDDRPPYPHIVYSSDDDDDDEDEAAAFAYKKACSCAPGEINMGWDSWRPSNRDYIPYDVEKAIRDIPEARLSCAPASRASTYDQPNTFMRKVISLY